jgi:hypothetical protein
MCTCINFVSGNTSHYRCLVKRVGLTKFREVKYDLEFIFDCVIVCKICLIKARSVGSFIQRG